MADIEAEVGTTDDDLGFLKKPRTRSLLSRPEVADAEGREALVSSDDGSQSSDEASSSEMDEAFRGFSGKTTSGSVAFEGLSPEEQEAILRERFKARVPLQSQNFPAKIKKAVTGHIEEKKMTDRLFGLNDVLVEALSLYGEKYQIEGLMDLPDWRVLRKTGR